MPTGTGGTLFTGGFACIGGIGFGLGARDGFGGRAGGFLFLALALEFIGATAIILGQALLFLQVALLGFLQLAQDLGTHGIGFRVRGGRDDGGLGLVRLHVGALLAHFHVHRGLAAAGGDGHFLHLAAVQGDLLRRGRLVRRLLGLAVGTAQEAEQLHLLGAGHDLVGTAELHAGLGQLFQQFLDRRIDQFSQLADGGLLRHSDPSFFVAPLCRLRRSAPFQGWGF